MKLHSQKTILIGTLSLLCAILIAVPAEKEISSEQQILTLKSQLAAISRQNRELADQAAKANHVLELTERTYESVAPGSRAKVSTIQANFCRHNLKQLDGATQQWAIENKKKAQDIPEIAGVLQYLKDQVLPLCPRGGTYSLAKVVSGMPSCSCPGHKLD